MEEPVDSDRQRHQCFLDGHLNRSEAKVREQHPTEYRRGQAYTEKLYQKYLNDPDNHDGMISHLEPDILESNGP